MSRFVRLALPLFVVLTGCSFTADFSNFSFEKPRDDAGGPLDHDSGAPMAL